MRTEKPTGIPANATLPQPVPAREGDYARASRQTGQFEFTFVTMPVGLKLLP